MADGIIKQLLVRIGYDVDEGAARRARASLDSLQAGLAVVARGAAVAATAAAAFTGALVANTAAMASDAKAIERQAALLGLTITEYQRLTVGASEYGAEADDVADAIATINDRALDAAGGLQSMADDFALVGLSVADLRGKNPRQLFDDFADAVASADDKGQSLAAMSRILGDDVARKLGPMIMQGSDAIRAFGDEAERAGLIMSGPEVRRMARIGETMGAIRRTFQGFRTDLAIGLGPAVDDILSRFREFIDTNRQVVSGGLREFAAGLGEALTTLAGAARRLGSFLSPIFGEDGMISPRTVGKMVVFGGAIAAVVAAVGTMAVAAIATGAAWPVVTAGLAAIGALIGGGAAAGGGLLAGVLALGAAVVLLTDDFLTWQEGGVSAIGTLVDRFWRGVDLMQRGAAVIGESFAVTWQGIKDSAMGLVAYLTGEFVDDVLSAALKVAEALALLPLNLVTSAGQGVAAAGTAVGRAGASLASGFAAPPPPLAAGASTTNRTTNATAETTFNISGMGLGAADVEAMQSAAEARSARSLAELVAGGPA